MKRTSDGLGRLLGQSPAMAAAFKLIKKAAPTEANILLQGETGTGKELAAQALHLHSNRAAGPFVPVDCASLPENLLEAELFGREKGAYTDAHQSRPGLLEAADGGTLFLDEIGDMPLALQTKLLRVIQERQIRRLGSNRFLSLNVRVIAATHRNLEEMAAQKKFRQDLYYRLNVISIPLPPLRHRAGDVDFLARHFLQQFSKAYGRGIDGFDDSAIRLLRSYSWPGNVRELQNAVERAVALAEERLIHPDDLPEQIRRPVLEAGRVDEMLDRLSPLRKEFNSSH